jgi:hypothetical protein
MTSKASDDNTVGKAKESFVVGEARCDDCLCFRS